MNKEEIKDFSMRIANSSKTELVCITYDIIINYIETAGKAYEDNDLNAFVFNIKKAQQFVNNLSSSLDFKYEISRDLMSLYLFMNSRFIKSIARRKPVDLDQCIRVARGLQSGFDAIKDQDTSGRVMKNSQEVYVGYTYGKTRTLNEVSVR